MTTYTSYRFTGPQTRRTRKGACPGCGKAVTRSRTFEHTVNPFNCTGEGDERRPKTWDEVHADVKAEADAWVPDFTCQSCEFAADLDGLDAQRLRARISHEGHERYNLRHAGKKSRAALCNQRMAIYATRIVELDPGTTEWPTSAYYDHQEHDLRYCCYYEFPDGQRCIYSELHGAGFHLSPTGQRANVGSAAIQ